MRRVDADRHSIDKPPNALTLSLNPPGVTLPALDGAGFQSPRALRRFGDCKALPARGQGLGGCDLPTHFVVDQKKEQP
jgi:hypothetical protein